MRTLAERPSSFFSPIASALVFIAGLAPIAGCAHGPRTATTRTLAGADPAPRRVELAVRAEAAGAAMPGLVVTVSIDGVPAKLLVDLGGPPALLAPRASAQGGRARVSLGGLEQEVEAAAVDTTANEASVGGRINPLQWIKSGALVLDPARGLLLLVEGTVEDARALAQVGAGPLISVPRRTDQAVTGVVVGAALDEKGEAAARLDTTGARTRFPVAYAGLKSRADTPPTATSDGKNTRELAGRSVRFAGQTVAPITILVDDGATTETATLGLDVLSTMVLVIPVDPKEPLWVGASRKP